jgi:hypothetical protein
VAEKCCGEGAAGADLDRCATSRSFFILFCMLVLQYSFLLYPPCCGSGPLRRAAFERCATKYCLDLILLFGSRVFLFLGLLLGPLEASRCCQEVEVENQVGWMPCLVSDSLWDLTE